MQIGKGEEMEAIIKLSSMGDIVHSCAVLPILGRKVDFIVDDSFKEILNYNKYINNVIPVKLRAAKKDKSLFWKELQHFRKMNYEKIYDLQGLIKSAFFANFATKNLIGYSNPKEKIATWFYDKKIESTKFSAIGRYLELFEIENDELLRNHPQLLFYKDRDFNILSKTRKNIILIIGGTCEYRKLPNEKWIELANSLSNENIIIPYADEKEKKDAIEIQGQTKNVQIVNFNLNDIKALISKVDLLIGNDTGPTFMAWANNVNNIILHGCTIYNKVLENKYSKSIEVSNKIQKGLKLMDKINVADILKKIDEF